MTSTRNSEVVLLSAGASVLAQVPLRICVLILQGAHGDGEGPHGEPRPDLAELHRVVARPDVDMVADFDAIVLIDERDNPVARCFALGRIPWWPQMLQDLDYPKAERRCKVLEDQMGVALADCPLD